MFMNFWTRSKSGLSVVRIFDICIIIDPLLNVQGIWNFYATNDTKQKILFSGTGRHQSKLITFFKDMTRSEMIKPLRLAITFFFCYHCASFSGFRPYMVMVFNELNLPVGAHLMTVSRKESWLLFFIQK